MNSVFIIVIGMLILSILAPFISLYAISFIKKKEYKTHIKIQKRLFGICVIAVIIFEAQIRFAGGSGSLVAESDYVDTIFFKALLIAHIIGAVLTYLVWGITVFLANKRWKNRKTSMDVFSPRHKRLGYFVVAGLFYTAITAILVCIFAFLL